MKRKREPHHCPLAYPKLSSLMSPSFCNFCQGHKIHKLFNSFYPMPIYFYKMKQKSISLEHMLGGQRQQMSFLRGNPFVEAIKEEGKTLSYVATSKFYPALLPLYPAKL